MASWEAFYGNQLGRWEITCKLLATQLESLTLGERCTSMNIYSDLGDYVIDFCMYKTELSVSAEIMCSNRPYFSKIAALLAL